MFPSSNWLGHHSFTVKIRDRAPVGMPNSDAGWRSSISLDSLSKDHRCKPCTRNHFKLGLAQSGRALALGARGFFKCSNHLSETNLSPV